MELSMTGVTVVANQLRGCERGEVSPPIEERSSIMQILISPINGIANLSGRLFRAAGGLFRSNPELLVAEPTNQPQAITSAPAPSPAPTSAPTPTPIERTTGTNNGQVAQDELTQDELRAARVARFDNSANDSTGGRNKRRTRRRKSKASKKQRKTRRKISKKARKTKKAKKSKKSKKAKKSRKSKK